MAGVLNLKKNDILDLTKRDPSLNRLRLCAGWDVATKGIFGIFKQDFDLDLSAILLDQNGKLLPDSERLTKFGKVLRATSLDELPELINILKGEMSLIGPRPLAVSYLPYYNKKEKHRHDVRPGLTGLAQINGRNTLNWEERFEYDIEYVNNITFINDIKILFKTAYKVFKRDGVVTRGTGKTIDFDEYRKQEIEKNDK